MMMVGATWDWWSEHTKVEYNRVESNRIESNQMESSLGCRKEPHVCADGLRIDLNCDAIDIIQRICFTLLSS